MRVRAPLATSWLATSMPAHNSSRVQWTWTPPLDFRYTRLDPQVPKSLQIINALILVIMNSSDINIIFHHSCAPDSPYVLFNWRIYITPFVSAGLSNAHTPARPSSTSSTGSRGRWDITAACGPLLTCTISQTGPCKVFVKFFFLPLDLIFFFF